MENSAVGCRVPILRRRSPAVHWPLRLPGLEGKGGNFGFLHYVQSIEPCPTTRLTPSDVTAPRAIRLGSTRPPPLGWIPRLELPFFDKFLRLRNCPRRIIQARNVLVLLLRLISCRNTFTNRIRGRRTASQRPWPALGLQRKMSRGFLLLSLLFTRLVTDLNASPTQLFIHDIPGACTIG